MSKNNVTESHIFDRHVIINTKEPLDIFFQNRMQKLCISNDDYENRNGTVLHNLSPGAYALWIRARSEAGFGPISSKTRFLVPGSSTGGNNLAAWSVLGVAPVIVICLAFCSYRRYKSRFTIPDTLDDFADNPFYLGGFAPQNLFLEQYLLQREDLRVNTSSLLGKGVFGDVYVGELFKDDRLIKVAVKTHKVTAPREEIFQFLQEAAIMQGIDCHHVVKFLGVVGDYAPVYVVMELMENGNLGDFLRTHSSVSDQNILQMAVQAADGMAYLAHNRKIHRDLAARNCLLDGRLTLKVGDFGLSRDLQAANSNYYRKVGGKLPFRWMAPESLEFCKFDSQSDVWSYGVLLWEMVTRGARPFKNLDNDYIKELVVRSRKTLGRPRNCPKPLFKVMQRCWSFEAKNRPKFHAIVRYLLKFTDESFQESFEQVSFLNDFENKRNWTECKPEEGYMTKVSEAEDHYRAVHNISDISDESSLDRDTAELGAVSAQVECLISCKNCPTCSNTESLLQEEVPFFGSYARAYEAPDSGANILKQQSDVQNIRTRRHSSVCCSNKISDTMLKYNTKDSHLYSNIYDAETSDISPSFTYLRWGNQGEDSTSLLLTSPLSPEDDTQCSFIPDDFSWMKCHSPPLCHACSEQTNHRTLSPNSESSLHKVCLPCTTATFPLAYTSMSLTQTQLSPPTSVPAMASAPSTPSKFAAKKNIQVSVDDISQGTFRPSSKDTSSIVVSVENRCTPKTLAVDTLGYIENPIPNVSTPLMSQREENPSTITNSSPVDFSDAFSQITGATPSPTSTLPELKMTNALSLPTSSQRAHKTKTVLHSPKPPIQFNPFAVVQSTLSSEAIPLRESSRSLDVAVSQSGRVSNLHAANTPSHPTSANTTSQQQQLSSISPFVTLPLLKKTFSSVLRSDLSSGQSENSISQQTVRSLTDLELM
ncbi:hypothetical protein SK128_023067 [Halocaridina rubra]|uniref:receptor protein-tyrosine kinase n=1 Tax=Halocaridina rubra TaxID=373956 RepID=A0AAN8XE01_HALRR